MFKDTAVPIDCICCGKEFKPNKPTQLYCSKTCRMVKYRNNKVYQEKTCLLCDTVFIPSHALQVYCSKGCYNRYRSMLYISSSIRPKIMEAIMERDNYKCQDCGTDIPIVRDKYNHGYLHHITPLLSGGRDTPANIVLLCFSCHSERHKHIRDASKRLNRASKILD